MLFPFSLLNASSSLYEAEVKVELARKPPKVEWTETPLPRQVNTSLLLAFVEPAAAITSSREPLFTQWQAQANCSHDNGRRGEQFNSRADN